MRTRQQWAITTVFATASAILSSSYFVAAHPAIQTSRQRQDAAAPVDHQYFRWSPDHGTLARVEIAQLIGTPKAPTPVCTLAPAQSTRLSIQRIASPIPKEFTTAFTLSFRRP